jgi:replicative DNA helicase
MQRLLASKMSYPIQALLDGLKGDNDGIRLLGSTAEKFKKHKDSFWIYGLGDFELNIDDIALICRKISREHGQIDMIYLDFLQDLEAPPHDRKMDERKAIEYNIKGFKKICSDNNCAGTVLSQFNRETHNQKRPTKKSFRGSGAIDDVSHVMSVLYREGSETEKPSDAPIETWWYSVKTRLIRPWNRKIGFIGKTCTYCGIESHRYGETDRPDQRLPYKD